MKNRIIFNLVQLLVLFVLTEMVQAQSEYSHPIRSLEGPVAAEVIFESRTPAPVLLYWIDYQDNEVFYRELSPGESYRQQTYMTYPWRARDRQTREPIKTVAAEPTKQVVIIDKISSPKVSGVATNPQEERARWEEEQVKQAQVSPGTDGGLREKALRELRKNTAAEKTATINGITVSFFLKDRIGVEECRNELSIPRFTLFLDVYALVPSRELLVDDVFTKSVMEQGKQFIFEKCGTLRGGRGSHITVWVLRPEGALENPAAYSFIARGIYFVDDGYRELKEYKNSPLEEVREAEAGRRRDEQQRLEQARIAKENAEREAARQRRWNEFVRKNGVQEMIDSDALRVNPFVYQGKTVAIHTHFERMLTPDTGKFGNVIVSGLPRDMFRSRGTVVLAGRVIGTTELKGREMGEPSQAPQLKFIGVHFCKDSSCSDMLK